MREEARGAQTQLCLDSIGCSYLSCSVNSISHSYLQPLRGLEISRDDTPQDVKIFICYNRVSIQTVGDTGCTFTFHSARVSCNNCAGACPLTPTSSREAVEEAEEALNTVDPSFLPHGGVGTRSLITGASLAKNLQSSTPPDVAGSIHSSDRASSSRRLPHSSSPGPHRRRDRNGRDHSDAQCSFSGFTTTFLTKINGTPETETGPQGNERDKDQPTSVAGGGSDCSDVSNSRDSDGVDDYCYTAAEKALAWRQRRRRLGVATATVLLPTKPTVGERAPPRATEGEEVIGEMLARLGIR